MQHKMTRSTITSSATGLLLATAILLTASQELTEARKSRCPAERDQEMDSCAARMGFLGDHSFLVPKNSTQMDKFCSELKESIGCIQSYSRDCLQGFTRQLLTSLLKRGKQQYATICQDTNSKAVFMKKMSCLSDNKIKAFHRVMDASIARFEHISTKTRTDYRLPALCCSYQIFNRDSDSTITQLCGKPTSRKTSTNEYVHKIVGGTAGEFFSLICDGLRSLDDCKASAKTSATLGQLEDVSIRVRQGKLAPMNKSLIPVLLEILDSAS